MPAERAITAEERQIDFAFCISPVGITGSFTATSGADVDRIVAILGVLRALFGENLIGNERVAAELAPGEEG